MRGREERKRKRQGGRYIGRQREREREIGVCGR